jgi:D-alanine-D-alanine ligase
MNIAIFTGGDSSEYVISMKSARQVLRWLEAAGHVCFLVEARQNRWTVHVEGEQLPLDKNSFSFHHNGEEKSFDFVWNTIHGTPGEDGKLQGCLDMMGIPYSSSNHLSSALTFDKYTCKSFLKQHGITTPEASLVRRHMETDLEAVVALVGLPCFVKPNNGGSSFGTTKVMHFEELEPALEEALKEDKEAIIERFIKGTEVTCGLMKGPDGFSVFPITEIIPENEFFDYEAKYTAGKAQEITPARIDPDIRKKCQNMARKIYDLTNCSGIIRVDFIIKGNQVYFLELNSIPGMSEESIIPKQVSTMGLEMADLLQQVIDEVMGR